LPEKKRRKFVKDVLATITIKIQDPCKEIDEARNREDFFSAFALAVSFFEYYGLKILGSRFSGIVSHDKFERLSANDMTTLLFCTGTISSEIYVKMIEVIKERNKLVHPKIIEDNKLNRVIADKLLEKAKESIRVLSGGRY
jgi:hypothetical protein